ncbi:MAG: rRNA maturation RNase YbeY [Candidatus Nanopelagicales bacterium]|nr:rRNA maturation RNase YbeY [Candidatus Nanopelagicales bacterium]
MIDLSNNAAGAVDEADLLGLATFLMSALGMSADAELSIALVDEDEMERLHREWLGEPGPTDVLSFPMDELVEPTVGESAVTGVLGDVVLCPSVAARQARSGDCQAEMRVLLTHGVLHLLGHDHSDQAAGRAMFARQAELVAAYERSATDPARDPAGTS